MRLRVKGEGSPIKVRNSNESEDLLEDWYRPNNRTSAEKRTYGPRFVDEKIALLREFNSRVQKKPEILEEVRAELAARQEDEPEMSRFALRLQVIHNRRPHKITFETRYFKTAGIEYTKFLKHVLLLTTFLVIIL